MTEYPICEHCSRIFIDVDQYVEHVREEHQIPIGAKAKPNFEIALDEVLSELRATLIYKNRKYGDSFFKQVDRYGTAAIMIPIHNKVDRLDSLYKDGDDDKESIEDSHLDGMGYHALTLVYKKLRG